MTKNELSGVIKIEEAPTSTRGMELLLSKAFDHKHLQSNKISVHNEKKSPIKQSLSASELHLHSLRDSALEPPLLKYFADIGLSEELINIIMNNPKLLTNVLSNPMILSFLKARPYLTRIATLYPFLIPLLITRPSLLPILERRVGLLSSLINLNPEFLKMFSLKSEYLPLVQESQSILAATRKMPNLSELQKSTNTTILGSATFKKNINRNNIVKTNSQNIKEFSDAHLLPLNIIAAAKSLSEHPHKITDEIVLAEALAKVSAPSKEKLSLFSKKLSTFVKPSGRIIKDQILQQTNQALLAHLLAVAYVTNKTRIFPSSGAQRDFGYEFETQSETQVEVQEEINPVHMIEEDTEVHLMKETLA